MSVKEIAAGAGGDNCDRADEAYKIQNLSFRLSLQSYFPLCARFSG